MSTIYLIFFALTIFAQQDSLLHIWKDDKQSDSIRIEAFSVFIKKYYVQKHLDSTQILTDALLEFSENTGQDFGKANAMRLMGAAYFFAYNYPEASSLLNKSLEFSKEIDYPHGMAMSFRVLGFVYRRQTNSPKALECFEKSADLFRREGNYRRYGNVLTNIGSVYKDTENLEKALESYEKAYTILSKTREPLVLASVLSQIASVHRRLDNYSKAIQLNMEAKAIREKAGHKGSVAISLNNLGNVYLDTLAYDKALECHLEALEIRKSLGSKEKIASSLMNVGHTYLAIERYEEAVKYCKQSYDYYQKIEHIRRISSTCNCLYKAYKGLENKEKTLQYLEKIREYEELEDDKVNQMKVQKMTYEKQMLADSLTQAQEKREAVATEKRKRDYTIAGILLAILLATGLYARLSFIKRAKEEKEQWILQNKLRLEHKEAERLKELDSFKSRFYTNITHEFRTPLTVILGMAEQIKEDVRDKKIKENINLISKNGKSLLTLINQLLDLSKLDNQSFTLQEQQADIVPYLRYLTQAFHSYANSKNLAIRFETIIPSLMMDFDSEQLKQVISNLLSNAIKFTPSGGEIVLSLSEKDSFLNINVSDTGIGIPPKNLPHIFDRFYQVDGSTTRIGEGSGIGLAHTHELIKLMGGDILVKSNLGKGTTFSIQLPIRNEMPMGEMKTEKGWIQGQSEQARSINATETQNSSLKTQNLPLLLIIEDNSDVVHYLKTCLADQYQIDVAYNGKIGIERALETIPDMIISDVMMPEKDGFEVCEALKTDERTSHIPMILLTAKADVESKIQGLKRGADAYLSKPFVKKELLVRLEMLVERQQRMAAYFSTANTEIKNQPEKQNEEAATKPPQAKQEPQDMTAIQEAIEIEHAFIQKVRAVIEKNYRNEEFALPELCKKIGMSRSQLFRKMKALIGKSPSEYIRNYRLHSAKQLLEKGELNVSEVAWEVGFKHPAHFSALFQEEFGKSPSEIHN